MAKKKVEQAKPVSPALPVVVAGPVEHPHIIPQLRHLAVPLADLVPDPENAKTHPTENLDVIKESLRKFCQDQPLVVQRQGNIIRKGNGRYQAAKEMGWTHLAAVFVDDDNVDAAVRAIIDNRSSELAKWDTRVLAEVIQKVRLSRPTVAPGEFGFTRDQVERLMAKYQEAHLEPVAPIPMGGQGEPENAVRMVQLFVSKDEHDRFSAMVQDLGHRWGLPTITATVLRALEESAKSVEAEHGKEGKTHEAEDCRGEAGEEAKALR